MNEIVIQRWFDYSDAFEQPLTRGVIIAVGGVLALTPLLVFFLGRAGRLTAELRHDLMSRWRSWIWISLAMTIPILLGAAWVILGVLVLSLLCYREFARATGMFREKLISAAVVFGILLVTFAVVDNYQRLFFASAALTAALIAMITIPQDRPKGYIQRVALGLLGFLLFGYSFAYIGLLTEVASYRDIVVLLLLGVEVNDVFAYCSGRIFGKRKLLPQTSPGKTVGGALGALVLTSLLVMGLARYVVFPGTPMARLPCLLVLGPGISILGQLGDLLMSSIKRDLGIKDVATSIPGHGGLLDRFDSLVLVAPAYYHFLSLVLGPLGAGNMERIFTGP